MLEPQQQSKKELTTTKKMHLHVYEEAQKLS